MNKINRTKDRIDKTGEVFTPPTLVNEILDKLPTDIWEDKTKTWLDPTCGEGAFLVEVKKRLMVHHKESHILNNMIFGVDLMPDNVQITILHLYGPGNVDAVPSSNVPKEFKKKGFIKMFSHNGQLVKNILCADGLVYDYSFGRPTDIPSNLAGGLFSRKKA